MALKTVSAETQKLLGIGGGRKVLGWMKIQLTRIFIQKYRLGSCVILPPTHPIPVSVFGHSYDIIWNCR